jgi:DNA 3'-phosphatase
MTAKFYPLLLAGIALVFVGLHALCAQTPSPVGTRQTISSEFVPTTEKVKIAFLDADSTLRVAPSGAPAANSPEDVAILPLLTEPLKKLAAEGYLLAVVSNQGGVEYGHITLEVAEQGLATILRQLAETGVHLHYFDFAETKGENRKPDIGMAKTLATKIKEKFGKEVDWPQCIMIGDSGWKEGQDVQPDGKPGEDHSNSDRLFAENLSKAFGCEVKFHHPRDFFGWDAVGVRNFSTFKDLETFQKRPPR